MVIARKYAPSLLCMFTVAVASLASANDDDLAVRQALRAHERTLGAVRRLIESIPADASSLSDPQLRAIEAAGVFRDSDSAKLLLPFVRIRVPVEEESESSRSPLHSDTLRRSTLQGYPAALALQRIGLPAATAIIDDLERPNYRLSDERVSTYAEIMYSVLRYNASAFINAERSHAPKYALPAYDRLLATGVIRKSIVEFQRETSENRQ